MNLATFREIVKGNRVRRTSDNMISTIDLIKEITGKDANQAASMYQRLISRCPEIIRHTRDFHFPGQGQRLTPVVDEEGAVKIALLLPVKYGAEFRFDAARIIPAQKFVALLPDPQRTALSTEQTTTDAETASPGQELQQKAEQYPVVCLHGAALKVVPDLIPWKEVNRLYLPDGYMSLYMKRRDGTYPFTAYKIGQAIFYYAQEIEAWIEARCPTVLDGWSFPCPVPSYLFKYIHDAERLGAAGIAKRLQN